MVSVRGGSQSRAEYSGVVAIDGKRFDLDYPIPGMVFLASGPSLFEKLLHVDIPGQADPSEHRKASRSSAVIGRIKRSIPSLVLMCSACWASMAEDDRVLLDSVVSGALILALNLLGALSFPSTLCEGAAC
jgi:hypothetical protein